MINLDKYEMRPLLTGATFPSVNPGPAAVAAWADHILKPGKQKCYHLSYTIIWGHICHHMTVLYYNTYEGDGKDDLWWINTFFLIWVVKSRWPPSASKMTISTLRLTWLTCCRLHDQSSGFPSVVDSLWTRRTHTPPHLISKLRNILFRFSYLEKIFALPGVK